MCEEDPFDTGELEHLVAETRPENCGFGVLQDQKKLKIDLFSWGRMESILLYGPDLTEGYTQVLDNLWIGDAMNKLIVNLLLHLDVQGRCLGHVVDNNDCDGPMENSLILQPIKTYHIYIFKNAEPEFLVFSHTWELNLMLRQWVARP